MHFNKLLVKFVYMKIKTVILLFIISTASLIAADNIYFTATSSGNNVNIEWRLNDESNISSYQLERSSTGSNFISINSQAAKGSNFTYKYEDPDAFAKDGNTDTQSKNIYTYRIKIIKKDNSYSYSDPKTVIHKVSGIRRTWGMIKEMFR